MQMVAIIDYGSGNLHSAAKAFERAAREHGVGSRMLVTSRAEDVAAADRVVLPGVGAFADCRAGLERVPGLRDALEEAVSRKGRPFLGICVGMQLIATRGLEHVATDGLGWIPGEVRLIEPADKALKVPHMGWNTLCPQRPHALLAGIPTGEDGLHAYFVHSYRLAAADPATVVATTDYGGPVTALVARDNIAGTQFHPEKSSETQPKCRRAMRSPARHQGRCSARSFSLIRALQVTDRHDSPLPTQPLTSRTQASQGDSSPGPAASSLASASRTKSDNDWPLLRYVASDAHRLHRPGEW
jgi:glutamine amidotransferase